MKKIFQSAKLLVIIAIILRLNACDTAEPTITSYRDKILFTSSRSGKEQLYLMNPDGTDVQQITRGDYSHSMGRWSPDGRKIICNTDENYSVQKGLPMVLMNYDGSNEVMLEYGMEITWHPDGSRIIYTNWTGGMTFPLKRFLHSININGTDARTISDKYTGINTFSPEGSRLAIDAWADSAARIAVLDFPQLNNPFLIGPSGSYYPNWFFNSDEIVFLRNEAGAELINNIYIMNSDGTNLRTITDNKTGMLFMYPRWSSDGQKIIFIAHTIDGYNKSYLYMINKDGANLHRIIDDDSITSCDWSR